ncbi:hypothetical protein GCM10022631_20590 [Deinococcus rubellus]|uniref:hypothetical protein n=1 Tax=Deinococcus rubellus TaxID=1889240 RepID=UPI0031F0FF66
MRDATPRRQMLFSCPPESLSLLPASAEAGVCTWLTGGRTPNRPGAAPLWPADLLTEHGPELEGKPVRRPTSAALIAIKAIVSAFFSGPLHGRDALDVQVLQRLL